MTTAAEEFLQDLLESEEEEVNDENDEKIDNEELANAIEGDEFGLENMIEDDLMDDLEENEAILGPSHSSQLLKSPKLLDVLELIQAIQKDSTIDRNTIYNAVVKGTEITTEIDNEITALHKFLRDEYTDRFPELEQVVTNPLDYARVIKQIGDTEDLTEVDLSGILPSANIMVVSVMGSTTKGHSLTPEQLNGVLHSAQEMLDLDDARKTVLEFTESQMTMIAPNVAEIVGSSIAARLIAAAGGLDNLSRMPACNIQVLGAKRGHLAGFSTTTANPRAGFIYQTDIIRNTPPALHIKTVRQIAGKVALAARSDAVMGNTDGSLGRKLAGEITHKRDKWQEPPPAKLKKPLRVPMEPGDKKHRRGGKKVRRMKERFAPSELRKAANRISFGAQEHEIGLTGVGLGIIGVGGAGKMRLSTNDKTKVTVKKNRKQKDHQSGLHTQLSGFSSSVAFTPLQGLELENPNALRQDAESGTESYFSETGTFSNIKPRGK